MIPQRCPIIARNVACHNDTNVMAPALATAVIIDLLAIRHVGIAFALCRGMTATETARAIRDALGRGDLTEARRLHAAYCGHGHRSDAAAANRLGRLMTAGILWRGDTPHVSPHVRVR